MNFELNFIDVSENLIKREQPSYLVRRPVVGDPNATRISTDLARTGVFWVPQSALVHGGDANWSKTSSGELVRVPIHAYRVPFVEQAGIAAVGTEIGMRAMADLVITKRVIEIKEVRLIVGQDVTKLPDDTGYRIYMGMTIRTE